MHTGRRGGTLRCPARLSGRGARLPLPSKVVGGYMSRSVFEAMSILVVDDSAYMRHLLMTLLQALGATATVTTVNTNR